MQDGQIEATRRTVLGGAAAVAGAVALGGCTTYGDEPQAAPPAADGGAAPTTGAPASGGVPPAGGAPAANALAQVSDIPVGGGKVFGDKAIVVTQPQAGTIKAFSAKCTHQGCIVSEVVGASINCACHGSVYNSADGSVVEGPATRPLAPVKVTVEGSSIMVG